MQVTKATYTSTEKTSVEVLFDTGEVRCFPDPLPSNIKVDLAVSAYSSWRSSNTPADYQVDPVAEAREKLAASDYRMARIGEDLINLLATKDVISKTELPPNAQEIIDARADWRAVVASSSSSDGA